MTDPDRGFDEALHGYPEVLCPYRAFPETHHRVHAKRTFWRSYGPWRSGFLTDPQTDAPYRRGVTLFTLLDERRRKSLPNPSYERRVAIEEEAPVRLKLEYAPFAHDRLKAHDSFLRDIRERKEEETTKAMDAMEEAMEHSMPQFFLRNIGRAERYEDDEPLFEREAVELAKIDQSGMDELRELILHYTQPITLTQTSYEIVGEFSRDRRQLLGREDWTRFFGKEHADSVDGALWKHFPDDETFERYGTPDSTRLDLSKSDE